MSDAAITHFFTQYQDYLALALVSLAPLRIGAILGRRFVRKDRPRWYPHLPPLPAKPTTPLSMLLDVAAYVGMAVCVVILVSLVLEVLETLASASANDLSRARDGLGALAIWLFLCGLLSYWWTTAGHAYDVHRYRYETDPAYRAEHERRRAEMLRQQEEEDEERSLAMAGIEPYATKYGYYSDE